MESIVDTYPKLLLQNYREHGNRKVAMRKKDLGYWNEYAWEECYQNIKYLALGLVHLGLEPGHKVCIIGDNNPEWYWAEIAVQAIGGVVVGLYVDAIPSEIEYLAGHSESRFAIAQDQEQTDKFLAIRDKLPKLRKVVYWDPKGMWSYKDNAFVIDFKDVMKMGVAYEESHPGFFEQSIEKGKASDTAVLCYTSGTTGALPKGAMLSYRFLLEATAHAFEVNPSYETDNYVSFVPPAWVAEQLLGIGGWLRVKNIVNFPEEPETVQANIKEIGPQCLLFGPGQWAGLLSMTQVKIEDSGRSRKLLYNLCLPIGYKTADFELNQRRKPPLFWRILHMLAEWICFRPIKDYLGLAKLRCGLTGGSALGPDTFHWFRALGVHLKDSYGLTEVNLISVHGDIVKVDTAGPPTPDMHIRISNEGEILARTKSGMFDGYYKQAAETTKIMGDDYWVKTGDAGIIDDEGHITVLDRLKDMLKLRSGDIYSPTYIENRLKFSPYVKDAMAVGGEDKDYVFTIISIDFDNVGKWAERNRVAYTTYADLSQKAEVYDLIQRDVERVNKTLPQAARVKQFVLLSKEFDADEGELTRSRKLRRTFMADRYGSLIDAAYQGKPKVVTEANVKYRDGREGTITLDINIRKVE